MKFYAVLLVIVMCFALCFACAEMENTVPQVGDNIAGFTVTSVEEYAPLDAKIVTMVHDKTGGPVMWIANDDTERSFQIGFRTHYDTESGVPHVFEHAALSGSEKYPDPALFFNMIQNTCQTYLNATTYTFMTIYPCSSISEKQLLKFEDVYLAGVFEPLVVTDEHAMQREAYRYEMEDEDAELTLTGTVYSEMLGNYYAYEGEYESMKINFPGSWYATCTGGKPGVIEEMTQQDLIDFHETYYQPSNAMAIFYGDLNISDFLEQLAVYYDRYEMVEVSNDDPNYTPFRGKNVERAEVSATADAAADVSLRYSIPIRGLSTIDMEIFGSVIEAAIYNNSSALYDIMMERYPESSFSLYLEDSGAEPMLYFCLEQAPDEDAEAFAATVQEGIQRVLDEGINYEPLNAAIKQTRIQSSRVRENSNIGVNQSANVMYYYALFGDMNLHFDVENTIINDIEGWIESGIIEKVLTEQVLDPEDCMCLTIAKIPGLMEEKQAAAEQKLEDRRASMTDEDVAAAVEATREFNEWSESVSEVSMINEVNVLTVDEFPEEVKSAAATVSSQNGVRYISSEVENCNTISAKFYLRADMVAVDDLGRLAQTVDLLGSCSTSQHSYMELQSLMTEYGMGFRLSTIPNGYTDEFTPVVVVSIDCLSEDFDDALALAEEILTETVYDEFDMIRYLDYVGSEQYKMNMVQNSPHYIASNLALAAIFDRSLYNYYTQNIPYYQYIESVAEMDDDALAAEAEVWRGILSSLVNRDRMTCAVISSAEGIAQAENAIDAMTADWPMSCRVSVDYASEMEKLPGRIAVVIPGSAAYHMQTVSAEKAGYEYSPDMSILDGLVYDQLLIPIMRYSNGVYSPISNIDNQWTYIMAYRDPSLKTTYEEVIPSLSGMVSSIELTDDQLSNLVVSAYTTLAMPSGPIKLANAAISDILMNRNSPAEKLEKMVGYKSVTVESVLANANIYDTLSEKGVIVSALPDSMVREDPDYFDLVITWYVE